MARVLVVEDDPAIRGALLRSLAGAGHAVTSQPTGMAGLTEAVDQPLGRAHDTPTHHLLGLAQRVKRHRMSSCSTSGCRTSTA